MVLLVMVNYKVEYTIKKDGKKIFKIQQKILKTKGGVYGKNSSGSF